MPRRPRLTGAPWARRPSVRRGASEGAAVPLDVDAPVVASPDEVDPVAAVVAARRPEVEAVVVDSPFATMRDVIAAALQRYRVPPWPTIAASELPREGRETLRLIHRGGPFPYDRDGITFQNRERILPAQPRGYYAEYTVPTPGESDRGARRLVAGDDGDVYFTDDHYRSFRQVEED